MCCKLRHIRAIDCANVGFFLKEHMASNKMGFYNRISHALVAHGINKVMLLTCLTMTAFLYAPWSLAQKNVIANPNNLAPIFLGQSAVMTGPTQSLGLEARKGIGIALTEVNQKGGIRGRMVLLKSLDDQGDAAIALANAKELVKDNGVVGLIGSVGTASSEAVAQVSEAEHVALVGPLSGSDTLRGASHPYTFHIRASHGQEVARLLAQIESMGMTSVSVVYQNDSFGINSLEKLEIIAKNLKLSVTSKAVIARAPQVNKDAVILMAKSSAPVIVVLATYDIAADFIKQLRTTGNSSMLMTMSVAGAKALNDQLLDEARGMGMSQVMPYPWSASTPMVWQYQRAMINSGNSEKDYNYSSLEGYVAARVALEALRKSGNDFSRVSFRTALETLGALDLGGYVVRLNAQNREGSNYIDMTVISASGRFLK
jgi:branched-chain amino acid transport system substrate-binding protein